MKEEKLEQKVYCSLCERDVEYYQDPVWIAQRSGPTLSHFTRYCKRCYHHEFCKYRNKRKEFGACKNFKKCKECKKRKELFT